MDNTYKILYSNINEFDDLLIDKKECDLNDDILTTIYQHYAYDGQLMHDYVSLINNYIDVGAHDKLSYSFTTLLEKRILLFEGYGKTWALTKEEMENNKNGN